ncbi:hypothetical protein HYV82_06085 [Candidatus Woesearchaeota archaeon]|nr:hypothetical protein [Candidatus Woesearchaeota archaeon]
MAMGPSSAAVAQDLGALVAFIDRQIREIGENGTGAREGAARGAAQDAAYNAQRVRAAVNALAQYVSGRAGSVSW